MYLKNSRAFVFVNEKKNLKLISDEDSSDDGRIIPKDLSSYLRAPIPVPVVHPRLLAGLGYLLRAFN